MNLTIERNCEQCGGEMELLETDTLLECQWCGVRHFLAKGDARYILPHREDMHGELVHLPYLRLKGSLFTYNLDGIQHKVIDTTISATGINILPHTLGLRPQTMRLQFASKSLQTTYLKHTMSWQDAIASAATVQDLTLRPNSHSQWIGETFSTIYQPLFIQDNLVLDGVTGATLAKLPSDKDLFAPIRMPKLGWQTVLMPTLCPNCGWDMQSDQASVVHLCPNCNSAWHNQNGGFRRVDFSTVHSGNPDITYLPFWQIRVDFGGINLTSLADFIRITNLPRVIKPEWEDEPLSIFCPAFKIRPKIFLRVAGQLTAAQKPITGEESLPQTTSPVSLSATDAEEAIKLILGQCTVAKRNIMPILPDITLSNIRTTLLFLPFFDNGYELCQKTLKIVINKQILKWGGKL